MKTAADILREAASVIEERGKLRDKPDGERSMQRAVEAYTSLRGKVLESELDGWIFMMVLKLARATAGKIHEDDILDICGYSALAAECISRKSSEDRKQALDELAKEAQEMGLYPGRDDLAVGIKKKAPKVPSGNWIEHDLSGCPFPRGKVVEVKYRNGVEEVVVIGTDTCLWYDIPSAPDYPYDIIAYKEV